MPALSSEQVCKRDKARNAVGRSTFDVKWQTMQFFIYSHWVPAGKSRGAMTCTEEGTEGLVVERLFGMLQCQCVLYVAHSCNVSRLCLFSLCSQDETSPFLLRIGETRFLVWLFGLQTDCLSLFWIRHGCSFAFRGAAFLLLIVVILCSLRLQKMFWVPNIFEFQNVVTCVNKCD